MAIFLIATIMLYGPYLWCHLTSENYSDYGIQWSFGSKDLKIVFILILATLIPLTIIAMNWPGQSLPRTVSLERTVTLALSGIVAAIVEETFYRGWLFTLVRRRFGPWNTILIVSAIFALSHLLLKIHILRFATFFPGLVMGFLREKSKNIVPGMIYHGIGNIWSIWFFPGM